MYKLEFDMKSLGIVTDAHYRTEITRLTTISYTLEIERGHYTILGLQLLTDKVVYVK